MENPAKPERRRHFAAALPVYLGIVIATGSLVLLHSFASLVHTPHLLEWFLFAALAVVTTLFPITISSAKSSISVSDTFFISAALLFGPAPATVALAVDSFALSMRRRHGLKMVAFNTVAPALSMWIASETFFLMARIPPLSIAATKVGPLITPLLCLTVIYFLVNSGLTAIAVGLETGRSPVRLWRDHFMWLGASYLASASVSLCLIVIFEEIGPVAVAVVVPILSLFHLTMRSSFGRLDDAERHVAQVNRLYTSTIETLAMAIDAKDDVTHSHVRRVQAYAVALAREIGVTDELTVKAIEAAALLHDTGKLAVPEHILNKPGRLTPAEFDEMKRHVDIGGDILALVDFPYPVVPIVRCHHENWDGTGYPRGVAGTDIPIGARILSVVDCFDALISDRPYRKRLTDEAALDILRERRGRMYDPQVVDAFIRIYKDVSVDTIERPEQREVLQRISQAHHPLEPAAATLPPAPSAVSASGELLAFVSVARLAAGAGTIADVLALSTGLIRSIVPQASGVWFMLNGSGDRLMAADAFGPATSVLRSMTMRVGERLSGWVAANRQVILNSDPALDLGDLATVLNPALKSCLCVPLASGEAVVGVLTLYASAPAAFTDDQGRLMQMIAPQVAQALELARRPGEEPQIRGPRDLKLVSTR